MDSLRREQNEVCCAKCCWKCRRFTVNLVVNLSILFNFVFISVVIYFYIYAAFDWKDFLRLAKKLLVDWESEENDGKKDFAAEFIENLLILLSLQTLCGIFKSYYGIKYVAI